MQVIHLCTSNDSCGNPRRAYAIFNDSGLIEDFFEEGFAGSHCLPEFLRDRASLTPSIQVTPTEWRKWRKAAKEHNEYQAAAKAIERNLSRVL